MKISVLKDSVSDREDMILETADRLSRVFCSNHRKKYIRGSHQRRDPTESQMFSSGCVDR